MRKTILKIKDFSIASEGLLLWKKPINQHILSYQKKAFKNMEVLVCRSCFTMNTVLQHHSSLLRTILKRVQTILYETLLPSPTKKELSREFERIHQNWIYLSGFHRNREKFKEAKAIGVIQHTSKGVFRLISKGDISFIHRNLAERLCRFHGQLSSIIQK